MSEQDSPVKQEENDVLEGEEEEQEQREKDKPKEKERKKDREKDREEEMDVPKERKEEVLKNSMVSVAKTINKEQLWKPYDFLFPGGKLAKLIKVSNVYKKNLPMREMLDKFKYTQMTPVINVIGGMEKGRGKFYAGIARAAFNTDAVIVDNGLVTGLEKFTLRRGVKLIGVAPEGEIKFPKINPSQVDPFELANGHTHLFLLNNPDRDLKWGGEVDFKTNLCRMIAEGKRRPEGVQRCKIVSILLSDASFDVTQELESCVQQEIPIIVVPGSTLCDQLIKLSSGDQDGETAQELKKFIKKGHLFYCNSTNSEDIAQLTHLLLSIRPW